MLKKFEYSENDELEIKLHLRNIITKSADFKKTPSFSLDEQLEVSLYFTVVSMAADSFVNDIVIQKKIPANGTQDKQVIENIQKTINRISVREKSRALVNKFMKFENVSFNRACAELFIKGYITTLDMDELITEHHLNFEIRRLDTKLNIPTVGKRYIQRRDAFICSLADTWVDSGGEVKRSENGPMMRFIQSILLPLFRFLDKVVKDKKHTISEKQILKIIINSTH